VILGILDSSSGWDHLTQVLVSEEKMRSRESLLRLHRFRTDDLKRQVGETDLMIQDLMRKHDELDAHVKFEEGRNGISDPNNVNYSMAAKSVRGRRDNILRTVAELRDQHEAMISKLEEESAELRKIELLVEKEGALVRTPVLPAVGAMGQTLHR
jgi:flagellar protein FliJ